MSIDRLRSIRARLLEREDPDALWFSTALAEYEGGARHGVTLDAVFGFGLGPGDTPWWEAETRNRRDEQIRRIARQYFGGMSPSAAAAAIARKVADYEATAWRAHRLFLTPPDALRDKLRGELFVLLKIGAKLSARTIRRALSGQHSPLFVANDV